mgnify:CR=1 FL=1
MLEVIYRIYQVADEETAKANLEKDLDFGIFSSTSKAQNTELLMDCIVCDDRDHFKNIIRDQYGENIAFRYSKKLQAGDLYCVIIGEHCYNTERYFNKITFTCDCCGAYLKTIPWDRTYGLCRKCQKDMEENYGNRKEYPWAFDTEMRAERGVVSLRW